MPKIVNHAALGWVSARHLQHLVARAEAAGLRADELLSQGGLDREALGNTEGAVPLEALENMLAAVAGRYPDPLLGLHLSSDIQPATYGVIGHLVQASNTLADALDVVVRYNGLLSNVGKTSLAHHPGIVEVRWDCLAGSAALRRQLSEYVIGSFAAMLRLLLPERRELLLAVHFAHARPAQAALAREYFRYFACPVHFDKPACALHLTTAAAQTRLHHSDVLLKEVLERHARTLLQQRRQQPSLVDEVQQLVRAMMADGIPAREAVASQLGLSGRSLHRKLEELGSSYREILDRVRLEIAQENLMQRGESLSSTAERLGFRSRQALLRWYKHLTGKTPGAHRQETSGVLH